VIYKLGELFCGPGGLALGAISARVKVGKEFHILKHLWATDYDHDTCKTYHRNISQRNKGKIICEDIRQLDFNQLDQIDAFAFGFPCNDFSIVGEQKGVKGNFGPLYKYGVNVINKFNPIFFVAENVGGLSSANEGMAFKKILNELRESGSGYNLCANLYKSEQYGIPQTRHRIIIVGIRKDLNIHFKVPKPTHLHSYISVREALENPKIPLDASNNELKRISRLVEERLSHIKPGENVWTANLPEHLKLNETNTKISQIYKRLDPNKPSYTITGSGGGGTHGYHYELNRPLTNRERARIQTFPDDFFFEGSIESVRKQIGMAVPPKLSKVIFQSILMSLSYKDYPFITPNINI
jgi:DNA (cytosine-5)-methyltransferase 1